MTIKQPHNMLRPKKILLTLMALSLVAFPLITNAQDFSSLTPIIQNSFQFFNIILIAIQAFLWPILLLLGGLLNNDLLFSGGMQTVLLNIWSAVRDFVNVMFVLGLLGVAVYNIIGIGNNESYSVKKALPKIAIALIAVNFSFLACKVVLDVVNVTTTAIFAMPMASDSLKKYNDPAEMKKLSDSFCNKITNLPKSSGAEKNPYCDPVKSADSGAAKTAPASGTPATPTDKSLSTQVKGELNNLGKSFFSTFNSRNVALVMAIELMDIVNIDKVDQINVSTIKSLTINTIFSLIFLTIYATAFIALFVALLVRVVVLWISIAISPLSFLGMAFEAVKSKFGDDDPFFKLFMKHALVPLPVALILTVGMIMIAQLKQISPGAQFSTNPADLGAITSGMSTIQDLIAGLATAAFIWIAAFKALSGTKADAFINPIKGAVQGFGTSLAKLPLYAPILPVGGGKKVGVATLGGILKGPEQYIRKRENADAISTGDKTKQAIGTLSAAKNSVDAKKAITEVIRSGQAEGDKEVQAKIAELINTHKVDMKNLNWPAAHNTQDKFLDALKSGDVKKDDLKSFVESNKQYGFTAAAFDPVPIQKAGEKALRDAGSGELKDAGTQELNNAALDLKGKLKELNTHKANGDDAKIISTMEEVNLATAEVAKLNKSYDVVKGIDPSQILDASGMVKQGQGGLAGNAKNQLDHLKPLEKEAAKKMLTEKVAEHLAGGRGRSPDSTQKENAEKIVEEILDKGSKAQGIPSATPPTPPTPPS